MESTFGLTESWTTPATKATVITYHAKPTKCSLQHAYTMMVLYLGLFVFWASVGYLVF